MKPLKSYHRLLIWFCVIPSDNHTSVWIQLARILFIFSIFIGNFMGTIASLLYFFKFVSFDFEQSLYALLQIGSVSSATYLVVFMLLSRHKITNNLQNLAQIYDQCNYISIFFLWFLFLKDFFTNENNVNILIISQDKDEVSFRFITHANSISEKMWQIYLKYGIGGFFVNHITTCALSIAICQLIRHNFDTNHLYHPYKTMLVSKAMLYYLYNA